MTEFSARKYVRVKDIVARTSVLTTSLLFLFGCAHSPALETAYKITGQISVADTDVLPDDLLVSINGQSKPLDRDGGFTVPIERTDIYEVQVSGTGIYESLHTFSHHELVTGDTILTVPDIALVEKKPGRRLLTFGGDLVLGRRYIEPRWGEDQLIHDETRVQDMKSILKAMKPYFEPADYAAINLESILAESEPPEHAPKSVVFFTHPDVTKALEWIGVDYVSLGNNHTYDYLAAGVQMTLDALEASQLGYSGAGMNEEEANKPHLMDLNGIPVSAWGFVGWKGRVTPHQVAEGSKGGAAYGDEATIKKVLSAGAKPDQIDIIQYHGSSEYSDRPSNDTETRLKLALDQGADLAIAHHPHVAQGFEIYNNKLIAYSLGNFAFDQFFYSTHSAAALNVWMDGETFYRAEVIPLHVKGYKPLPATGRVRDYTLDRMNTLSAGHGTVLSQSGGHAVIDANQDEAPMPLSGSEDILFVGDFEAYETFSTRDRSWTAENAVMSLTASGRAGTKGLRLDPIEDQDVMTFGTKTFMRVFPNRFMRWQGVIDAPAGTIVSAYIQRRPRGMNRYEALDTAPLEAVGEVEIVRKGWTDLQFDFEAPSWKSDPSRILLKIEHANGSVIFDDIEVVPAKPKEVRETHQRY